MDCMGSEKFSMPLLIWKPRKSSGPDVEQMILVPVLVAVEDKDTPRQAVSDIGQILRYLPRYDAVFVRVFDWVDGRAANMLVELAAKHGLGVIVEDKPYEPIGPGSNFIIPAQVAFKNSISEKISRMQSGYSFKLCKKPISSCLQILSSLRGAFKLWGVHGYD